MANHGPDSNGSEFFIAEDVWDEALFQRYILEMIDSICARVDLDRADTIRRESMEIVRQGELDACRGAEPFPGVVDALDTLAERGYAMGIFTRNSREGCELVLEHHPLPCAVLFARDDVENVKPHPGHLERTLAALDCPPELAVIVGDHHTDVETAREVGAHAIGVLTTTGTREKFAEVGARLVLPSAAELPDVLADTPAFAVSA